MTQHHRRYQTGEPAVKNVEIATADTTCGDLHQGVEGTKCREVPVTDVEPPVAMPHRGTRAVCQICHWAVAFLVASAELQLAHASQAAQLDPYFERYGSNDTRGQRACQPESSRARRWRSGPAASRAGHLAEHDPDQILGAHDLGTAASAAAYAVMVC